MITPKTFGSRVYNARSKMGLSQAALGEKVGLTGSRIAQMESGGGFPRKDKMRGFAKALRISVDSLFGKDLAQKAT